MRLVLLLVCEQGLRVRVRVVVVLVEVGLRGRRWAGRVLGRVVLVQGGGCGRHGSGPAALLRVPVGVGLARTAGRVTAWKKMSEVLAHGE